MYGSNPCVEKFSTKGFLLELKGNVRCKFYDKWSDISHQDVADKSGALSEVELRI